MKIALCLSDDVAAAARLTGGMIEAQRHERECETRCLTFAFGALGVVGRPGESRPDWYLWEGEDGSFLAIAGLPIARDGASAGGLDGASPVVRGALSGDAPDETLDRLGRLDGAFVAVWWSARHRRLAVVTDFLGMQPLYRASRGGAVLFASEVKAFARSGAVPVRPDAGAWGAMLYFGHQIGPRTLLEGVTRVAGARAMLFDAPAPDGERTRVTWEWPTSGGRPDSGALREEVGEAVRADVAAYAAIHPQASLLLSGGFDSRLILCLCRDLGLRPRLLVQSHPDENADADGRFAVAFARRLGMEWRSFPARPDFYGTTDYLRFLALNEIGTPSLYLFIPNVLPVVRGERKGVWEGLLLDPALKFDHGEGGFPPYLEARTGARRRRYAEAARRLFARAWADRMDEEYEDVLDAERARYPDDAEGVWRFSVSNRSRFRTGVNPYQVYDTTTPPLTPGMSRRFWEVAATIDPRARLGKRLYRSVFEQLAPDGLRTPIASGASLIRGRGGLAVYGAQRARARIETLARRERVARFLRPLGLSWPFAWRRSPFLDVALAEASLDDPVLDADWVRAQRSTGAISPVDELARELLLYWRAWHHVMGGTLLPEWGAHSAA